MPGMLFLQQSHYHAFWMKTLHFFFFSGNTKRMKKNFMVCGLTGWCMEILFTSFGSARNNDFRLMGQTSIWMFPIYGMASMIGPIYHIIKNLPTLYRGIIYSIGIFFGEYLSGTLLKRHNLCPWDYSNATSNIDGVIRLDYAPFWMLAGLIFEHILDHDS